MDLTPVWNTLIAIAVVVLRIGVIGVFYYFSLIVHELGHVAGALMVGWKPTSLCIGYGKRRTVFSFGGVEFQVGVRLSGGMVYAFAQTVKGFRAAQFLFTLGGPFASACLAAALFLAADAKVAEMLSIPSEWIWILFGVECWLLMAAFWPRIVYFGVDSTPSDGLLLWRTLWIKKKEIPNRFLGCAIHYSSFLLKKGRIDEARQVFDRGVAVPGVSIESKMDALVYWICLLLEAGRDDEARVECHALLAEHPEGSPSRIEVLDQLAGIPIFFGHRTMIPDALEFIEKAIEEAPNAITLKGTKGSLLIEQGELSAGMQLIEEVQAKSESENDLGICTWYVALAHHKQGNVKKAHEVLNLAKVKYPDCHVARRIEADIWASPIDRVEIKEEVG